MGDPNHLNKLTRYELLQTYGKHADIEESIWGAEKTRRAILKPLQSLFHGEKNSKRFRQKLDQLAISTSSKRRNKKKETGFGLDIFSNDELDSSNMKDKGSKMMPLSQLILNAAED